MTKTLDTENFALDLLTVAREVARDHASLDALLKGLFSGPQGESEMMGLIRAVIRLRSLEMAILQSLSALPNQGPIGGSEIYRDLSKAVIMVAVAHNEEATARLRTYYPHLLSDADTETIRLTVTTGMNRQDLGKAVEYLQAVQERLDKQLNQ